MELRQIQPRGPNAPTDPRHELPTAFSSLLRPFVIIRGLLWVGIHGGFAHDHDTTPEIRTFLHLWVDHLHGKLCYFEGSHPTRDGHAGSGSIAIHGGVPLFNDGHTVFYIHGAWGEGICDSVDCVRDAIVCIDVVSHDVFAGGCSGDEGVDECHDDHDPTGGGGMFQVLRKYHDENGRIDID
eukprot:854294_1